MEENDRIGEAGENYLEAILELETGSGRVRLTDVATRLGVSKPSVSKAIRVLKEAGMVEQQHYGSITLTPEGRQRAADVSGRHHLLKTFLVRVLEVDPIVAEDEACHMEHDLSSETIKKMARHVESILAKPLE